MGFQLKVFHLNMCWAAWIIVSILSAFFVHYALFFVCYVFFLSLCFICCLCVLHSLTTTVHEPPRISCQIKNQRTVILIKAIINGDELQLQNIFQQIFLVFLFFFKTTVTAYQFRMNNVLNKNIEQLSAFMNKAASVEFPAHLISIWI